MRALPFNKMRFIIFPLALLALSISNSRCAWTCCRGATYDNPEVCCGGEIVPDVLCCGNKVLQEGESCCGEGTTEAAYKMESECCVNNGSSIQSKLEFSDYKKCPDRVTRPGFSTTANGCSSPYGDTPLAGDTACSDESATSSLTFAGACDNHDICSGGQCYPPSVDGFGNCNTAFFDDLLDVCDKLSSPDCRVACLSWAYIYYAFVGGQLQKMTFFDPGQNAACQCCP